VLVLVVRGDDVRHAAAATEGLVTGLTPIAGRSAQHGHRATRAVITVRYVAGVSIQHDHWATEAVLGEPQAILFRETVGCRVIAMPAYDRQIAVPKQDRDIGIPCG